MKQILAFFLCLAPTLALAHAEHVDPAQGGVPLHVADLGYTKCFFDLSNELTQPDFDQFAAEVGEAARFQQLASPATLGKGVMHFAVVMTRAPIDDHTPAWNNTMAHPNATHYLGDAIQIPSLVLRVGLTDAVDVGVWGSVAPGANYGIVGVDGKLSLLQQGADMPVSLSIRPHATALLGPDELWLGSFGADATVGVSFYGVTPYVGVGGNYTLAVETSNDVDLDPGTALRPVGVAGLAARLGWLNLGAEVTVGELVSYGLLVGASL